jgi:L-arabinose transport system ATP-binding protein
MEEIFRICDQLTVMRDGKKIITYGALQGISTGDIIVKMVGRDIADIFGYKPREKGPEILAVDGITGYGIKAPVTFKAAQREIIGIFGLVGAGRTELLKLIYGAARVMSGTVKVGGVPAHIESPIDAIKRGIILLPEDRKKEGIIPVRSVKENINLSARRNAGFVIDEKWEEKNSREMVEKLKIKTPSLEQLIQNLSGGNQQKAILARWLSEEIKVLLLDEPTRGIDIGAKSEIYSFIYELAEKGAAVIMVSSDLPEVLGVSDRVLVMCEGKITGELARQQATSEKVMKLALPDKAGMH